jgi:CheY-like chemotaxis protein
MTANAMRGDREQYLAIGMNDYLSKPIRIEALVAVLKTSALARAAFKPGNQKG